MTAPTGRVILPRDLSTIIKDLDKRIGRIERHSPVLPLPVLTTWAWGSSNTSGSAYSDIPTSVSPSFQLQQQTDLLVVCYGYGKTSGASGTYSFIHTRLSNGPTLLTSDSGGSSQIFDKTTGALANFFLIWVFSAVQPGTWTAALQAGSDVGQTLLIQVGNIYVFRSGG